MLNFDVTKKCLVGEGWCPIFAKSQVKNNTFNLNHYDHSFFLQNRSFRRCFLLSNLHFRSRIVCSVPHFTAIHKLEQYFMRWTLFNHRLHISELISLPMLSRKLLMHMGMCIVAKLCMMDDFFSIIYLGLFSSCLVLIIITECYQIN